MMNSMVLMFCFLALIEVEILISFFNELKDWSVKQEIALKLKRVQFKNLF
jgi:putative component of toxin-antitoxin plasmid stabilization module